MSWLAKLYETYEEAIKNEALSKDLEPYYHKTEQCHVEIIINDKGNFDRAEPLIHEIKYGNTTYWKGQDTVIPITPKSLTGRTSGPAPYPLAEQIQYIAKDYPDYGGEKKSYFDKYYELLHSWACSEFSHYKVEAICKYVAKGTVVYDLVDSGILFTYINNGKKILITNWLQQGLYDGDSTKKLPKPPLLQAVNGNEQGNVKIRWRVQREGQPDDLTWRNPELIKRWQDFQRKVNKPNGVCQITGKQNFLTKNHPKGILPKANDAKLICAPTDETYLTYQGRFTEYDQVCPISFEVSQKAHNALRWLISRPQSYKEGEQVFITWSMSGKNPPSPLVDSFSLLKDMPEYFTLVEDEDEPKTTIDHSRDLGESFAQQFKKYLAGYPSQFQLNDQIVIMGLDSATTGRMGIIYYRELLRSEFFRRLEDWHNKFAWLQPYSIEIPNKISEKKQKIIWTISAPAPRSIVNAAYGDILKSNTTLRKKLLERIVPCIVDGQPFPQDIMVSSVRRACNRTVKRLPVKFSNQKSENAEWEKHLSVTCALYKGYYQRHPNRHERREYSMNLDKNSTSRDYLYGRLLAIADRIEEIALRLNDENRPTNAARLMQRFADRPFSTWRTLELNLQPYMQRLQGPRAGFLTNRKKELDAVVFALKGNGFTIDKPLTGEFLLGYHCQRMIYRNTTPETTDETTIQVEESK